MPFIMVAVLIDMISIGLMLPVLPHIVGQFTHSNDEQTLAFLAVTLTFGIANFVSSPILGALSDRFGRRPVLLLGFAGLALSFFVTAAATALWMLVAVRMFSGAMQSNISIANAYVADISAPQDRARRFGLLGAMFGVGFILGPVIGGVLGDIDVRLPFVVAGCMALSTGATASSCCPSRCRKSGAARSSGGVPIRWPRSRGWPRSRASARWCG